MDDDLITRHLAARYASAVATRCLWLCAGGDHGEIDYESEPRERWAALWSKASRSDRFATSLLREMLFDSPGDTSLLSALPQIAAELETSDEAAVQLFLARLESLDREPEGGTDENEETDSEGKKPDPDSQDDTPKLLATLAALPEWPLERAFAALAPSFQGRLHQDFREALSELLEERRSAPTSPGVEDLTTGGQFLIDSLPELETDDEIEGFNESIAALADAARRTAPQQPPAPEVPDTDVSGPETPSAEEGPARAPGKDSPVPPQEIEDPLFAIIGELRLLVAPHGEEGFLSALAGLARYFGYRIAPQARDEPTVAAAACLHALWATTGLPRREPAEEAADSEGEERETSSVGSETGGELENDSDGQAETVN